MPHNIHTETPLIPEILAHKVLWNTIEQDEKLKKLDIEQAYNVVQALTPTLVSRAEKTYKISAHFRKQINDSNKDCREVLKMFMQHWVLKLIKTGELNF